MNVTLRVSRHTELMRCEQSMNPPEHTWFVDLFFEFFPLPFTVITTTTFAGLLIWVRWDGGWLPRRPLLILLYFALVFTIKHACLTIIPRVGTGELGGRCGVDVKTGGAVGV